MTVLSGWRPRGCKGANAAIPIDSGSAKGDVDLRQAGLAGDRGQRWQGREDRPEPAARAGIWSCRRDGERVHVRESRVDPAVLSGPQAGQGDRGGDRAGSSRAPERRRPAGRGAPATAEPPRPSCAQTINRDHRQDDQHRPRSRAQARARRSRGCALPTAPACGGGWGPKERLFANPSRPGVVRGRRRAAAAVHEARADLELPELLLRRPAPGAQPVHAEAAEGRRDRGRRHDPRPDRRGHRRRPPRIWCSWSSPPARTRRRSTRNRSSTAGSCWRRPPCTAPPASTRSSAPARRTQPIGQVLLMSKQQLTDRILHRPARADLRVRTPRHPSRTDRPPRPRRDRIPLRLRPRPHRLRPRMRALAHRPERHRRRRRYRLERRHLKDQRHPDPRPPRRRLDHRHHNPPAPHPPRRDETQPNHQR